MQQRERAQRLLRCLDLPAEAPRVLSDSRFWHPDVCAAFLDRCDDQLFDDPGSGLPMARVAPTLIHLLRPTARRDDLLVRSLSVLGSALRVTGSLGEADETYRTAFAIALKAVISPLERANLFRRYVVLCLVRGRLDEAEGYAQQAIDILTSAAPEGDGDDCLGAALIQRGLVRLEQNRSVDAADDFALALEVLDPVRNPRSHHSAVHNLAYSLARVDEPRALQRVSRHLQLARDLARVRPDSMADYKLSWIEAILLRRMGSWADAEARFVQARDGLARLGATGDMVRASIELALVYRAEGRLDALTQLVDETLVLCRAMGVTAEAIALLTTWRQAMCEQATEREALESLADRVMAQLQR